MNGREQVSWASWLQRGAGKRLLEEEQLILGYEPQAASDDVG